MTSRIILFLSGKYITHVDLELPFDSDKDREDYNFELRCKTREMFLNKKIADLISEYSRQIVKKENNYEVVHLVKSRGK